MDNNFKLYGVIDKSTGKLVSDITNPRHKYWDKKGVQRGLLETMERIIITIIINQKI